MNSKSLFLLALLTLGTSALTSCNKNKAEAGSAEAAATGTPVSATAGTIAYVDVDSLQNKYQFYLDGKAQLEEKVKTYQTAISQKETALTQLQSSIQSRLQNGQISTEEQYNSEMAKFQQQQQSYYEYRTNAEQEISAAQEQFSQALQDSLDNFIAEYNKSKGYSIIINKAVTFYVDKSMDITDEVAAGLNKRYKK